MDDDPTIGPQTSVDQLQDVKSTDWAYEALKQLNERYNCLTLPRGKSNLFEGDRAITRYEFADGLNVCLQQMEKLIGNVSKDFIRKDDLETLGNLGQKFESELNTIRTRVGKLEEKTGKLEENQFSTKVKLSGDVIVSLGTFMGDKKAVPGRNNPTENLNDNTILSDRVRINLDAANIFLCNPNKFKNKSTYSPCTDNLKVRFQAGNTISLSSITGTAMGRFGFGTNTTNNFEIHRLEYKYEKHNPETNFNNFTIIVAANGEGADDMMIIYNSLAKKNGDLSENPGTGSISRFGRFPPIFGQSSDGAGLSATYNFSPDVGVTMAYLTTPKQANNPLPGQGLFNGGHSIFIQLDLWKTKNIIGEDGKPKWVANDDRVGFTYANSYGNDIGQDVNVKVSANTGSLFGDQPFGNIPTSSHHFGIEGSYKVSSIIFLDGYVGYTLAEAETTSGFAKKGNQAEMLTAGARLGIGDQERNLFGLIVGMPPKVVSNDVKDRVDYGISLHIEAFYRFRLDQNDNKSSNRFYLTPGFIYILNPEHNSNNSDIFVGTMRFTFQF